METRNVTLTEKELRQIRTVITRRISSLELRKIAFPNDKADTQTKINYDTAVSREFWDMIQPLVSFTEGFSKRNPYRLVVKYCGDLNN